LGSGPFVDFPQLGPVEIFLVCKFSVAGFESYFLFSPSGLNSLGGFQKVFA